jgi:hypothetical protein
VRACYANHRDKRNIQEALRLRINGDLRCGFWSANRTDDVLPLYGGDIRSAARPSPGPLQIPGRTTLARENLSSGKQRFLPFLQMLIESSELRRVRGILGHQMDYVHGAFAIK